MIVVRFFLAHLVFNYLNPGIHLQFSGHCFVCVAFLVFFSYGHIFIFLFSFFVFLSRLIALSIVMYCSFRKREKVQTFKRFPRKL